MTESWQTWYDLHGARLLLYARSQARAESDAEDILQEAFVRVWKARKEGFEVTLPLFFRAIRQIAIDHARRTDRRSAREEQVHRDAGEPVAWFERTAEASERQALLEDALRTLPSEQQEVVVLKIFGDLTFAQIAEQVGCSLNTAASRYRYALAALKRTLSPSVL